MREVGPRGWFNIQVEFVDCFWFADEICSNPECLAKAHIAITAQGEIVEMVYPWRRVA